MLRGIYTSSSGMLADQRRLDVVANNLANVTTTGFKRETTVSKTFPELLVHRVNDQDAAGRTIAPTAIGRMGIGTFLVSTSARLTTGSLQQTGNPLDVALAGDGFFAVRTPQGIRYTRQGSFVQNAEGTLVTPQGHPVLVNGSPVTAAQGRLTINNRGEVLEGDRVRGQLTVATTQQLGAVRKEGDGLWAQAGAAEASTLVLPFESTGRYELKVGYLEGSNVEAVTEMVEMMETMRSFEANQRALQVQDETLGRAVTEIARIG
ncbi:MAG TPA: flagellar hook-basal body protein [Symbiobacteriaceae bacterium]|nr:flagellar hook-basal body protein [Symbiobacteriaceae bacterium]